MHRDDHSARFVRGSHGFAITFVRCLPNSHPEHARAPKLTFGRRDLRVHAMLFVIPWRRFLEGARATYLTVLKMLLHIFNQLLCTY
jgi:hypothetical protein